MVGKKECIDIFNAMIRGTPVPFKEKLLPIISEYLTENNVENFEKKINLIIQNPQLVDNMLPDIVDYYCRKYNIFSIIKTPGPKDININKVILYYEWSKNADSNNSGR